VKTVAKILGGLAFSAIYVSCEKSYQTDWGGVLFGIFLGLAAAVLYGVADRSEQQEKDTDAYERVQEVLDGKDSFYYLYLRPFSITNKLKLTRHHARPVQDNLKPEPVRTLEAVVERALRARGIPLLALGRPGEAIGAGRVKTTDEDWQRIFETLAKAATGFIVVPSLTSGTWWEIDWLVHHKLIHKTVFICPENLTQEETKLFADEYRKLGLRFPENGAGSVLKLSENGDVIARFSVNILLTPNAGQIIQEMKLLGQANGGEPHPQTALPNTLAPLSFPGDKIVRTEASPLKKKLPNPIRLRFASLIGVANKNIEWSRAMLYLVALCGSGAVYVLRDPQVTAIHLLVEEVIWCGCMLFALRYRSKLLGVAFVATGMHAVVWLLINVTMGGGFQFGGLLSLFYCFFGALSVAAGIQFVKPMWLGVLVGTLGDSVLAPSLGMFWFGAHLANIWSNAVTGGVSSLVFTTIIFTGLAILVKSEMETLPRSEH
jgi:hypothetical protein